MDETYFKRINFVSRCLSSLVIPLPENVSFGETWESIVFPEGYEKPPKELFETKLQELIDAQPWKELREERNRRLTQCDWVLMPDVVMTEEVKQAWLDYRQALRDLPANTTDPSNPVWPQAPN